MGIVTHIKVQLFWEGHKNLRNLPHGFDMYLVNVKTIFVAFSEKLNIKSHGSHFFVKRISRYTLLLHIHNCFLKSTFKQIFNYKDHIEKRWINDLKPTWKKHVTTSNLGTFSPIFLTVWTWISVPNVIFLQVLEFSG